MTQAVKSNVIAVGIIRKDNKQLFITQRGERSHLAGYWEFPGGKVKPHETPEQALERELEEEIDIKIQQATLLTILQHEYQDRTVILHFFLVEKWDGEPFAQEGQNSRWINLDEMAGIDFPEANQPLIELLLSH